jgi:hypothetical protein
MADEHPVKAIEASMNGTTETLSPCLRLLIEILLNEAITKKSEDSAVKDIDLGETEGWRRAVSNPLSRDLYRLRGCDSSRELKQVESETKVADIRHRSIVWPVFPNVMFSK